MTVQDWTICLLYAAAPAQTLFVLGFGLFNKWWTSLIGRALFTKALALALLLDLSVISHAFDYQFRHAAEIGLGVFSLVCAGAYMQLLAWVLERYRARASGVDRFDLNKPGD